MPTPGPVLLVLGSDPPAPGPAPVLPGTHLVFSRPLVATPGPVRLVFGDEDDTPTSAIPDATLQAAGTVSGLRLRIGLGVGTILQSTGTVTGLRLQVGLRAGVRVVCSARIAALRVQHIAARYDINVSRPTVGRTGAPWQHGQPLLSSAALAHQGSQPQTAGWASRWQRATAAPAPVAHPLPSVLRAAWHAQQPRYQTATRAQRTTVLLYQAAMRVPLRADSGFQAAVTTQCGTFFLHQDGARDRRLHRAARWQSAQIRQQHQSSGFQPAQPSPRGWLARHQNAMVPRPGRQQRPGPVLPDPCYTPALPAHLVFDAPFDNSLPARLVFVCERHGPPGPADGGVVVPVRRVYIVINSISIHRVDTGAELRAHSFSMSLDHKSWTWSWSASLHHDAANHLGRDSQGEPAELAVVVNGLPFRLRLEHITRDKRFSPTRWAVSGKGKASVLSAPYAPVMQFGNPSSARTAQQLMADVLTVNGVGMGWGLDWQLQDWLVPAGAWALQGSHMDAINDIAGAAGGYVQPHPTDSTLRILPTYPAAPWDWEDVVTPDFTIPASVAEVEGTDYIDLPAYNRVFVGGVGVGVFGPRTRTGTAGDVIAPQVTHALITDATAHRQRGLAELSDTGRQEHITLNLQVLPETGLIVPGQFVRYMGDKPALGIVRSTSLNWSVPKLRQSIVLETHV